MNEDVRNRQPEAHSPGAHNGFKAALHPIVVRFFQFADKYRYAPLGTALAAALTVFAAGGTLATVTGIVGSTTLFLSLGLISVVTFTAVHSALLYRSRALARSLVQPTQIFEIRRDIDTLLPTINRNAGETIQRIVHQYETQIRKLQDDLSRIQQRDIPGQPVLVEAGSFVLGSNDDEPDEAPAHEVFISAFLMDKYPVTNRQFAEFINEPDSEVWQRDAMYKRYGIPYWLSHWDGLLPPSGTWDHPVVNINWFACAAFCNWRSNQEKRQPVYAFAGDFDVTADFSGYGWRLPTEAEWEKAARAGHENLRYPWEGHLTPTRANYGKHYRGTTPVGQFQPNDFGLFDMLGNVKEWCHDSYSEATYPERSADNARDPACEQESPFRVFRGGSWMDQPEWMHLSKRGHIYAQNMNPDFGFRCVRRP